jgi:hypothetical protein
MSIGCFRGKTFLMVLEIPAGHIKLKLHMNAIIFVASVTQNTNIHIGNGIYRNGTEHDKSIFK